MPNVVSCTAADKEYHEATVGANTLTSAEMPTVCDDDLSPDESAVSVAEIGCEGAKVSKVKLAEKVVLVFVVVVLKVVLILVKLTGLNDHTATGSVCTDDCSTYG